MVAAIRTTRNGPAPASLHRSIATAYELPPIEVRARLERVPVLNEFFDGYRSGDECDREAITHVMACSSHFSGLLLADDFADAGSAAPPLG